MNKLRDTIVEGETIVVSDERPNGFTSLGPNLELRDCTVVFSIDASALVIASPRLISCTLHAQRALGPLRWYSAYLNGCRFRGTFVDNDFGHWPEYFDPQGALANADFTEATLNGCQFINIESERVAFPPWPCFTIPRPREREQEFKHIDWPYGWDIWAEAYTEGPPQLSAVTGYAPYLVKRYGGTVEEMRTLLERLGGIVL